MSEPLHLSPYSDADQARADALAAKVIDVITAAVADEPRLVPIALCKAYISLTVVLARDYGVCPGCLLSHLTWARGEAQRLLTGRSAPAAPASLH